MINIKTLTETLHDKYKEKFLGLSGNDKTTTIYFENNNIKESITISLTDSIEDILKQINDKIGE